MKTLIALAVLMLAGCSSGAPPTPASMPATGAAEVGGAPPCNPGLALVNAALWMQSSAEYKASALQTYTTATRMLDAALASGTGPAAVILDLDETTLDNSAFEAQMVNKGKAYDPDDWRTWVDESRALAVPGALEFLNYAKSRGVTPFYITNRKSEEEPGTRRNLEKLGFPLGTSEDTLLTRGERPEWQPSDKGPRRDYVASKYRVLLVLGDDLNDFANAHDATMEQRDAIVANNAANWGTRWLIVPNPAYGSWERAVSGGTLGCEQLKRKVEALRP